MQSTGSDQRTEWARLARSGSPGATRCFHEDRSDFHDYPSDESDDRASQSGRKAEFGGGKRGGWRVAEQANDQPNDSAGHATCNSTGACPSRNQRHAA
jgi:hypothetical protein